MQSTVRSKLQEITSSTASSPQFHRNEKYWRKDIAVKGARKLVASSQHLTNSLVERYRQSLKYTRSNLRLTVGKQSM